MSPAPSRFSEEQSLADSFDFTCTLEAFIEADALYELAVGDVVVYREMLQTALAYWQLDRQRLVGAEQRLRQVMGLEGWDAGR